MSSVPMSTVAVVGASLSGWRAAQELREQGFDGRLVIIGSENRRPYDRPALSKEFLAGQVETSDLALGTEQEESELEAQWWLGQPAARLDPRGKAVVLADGTTVRADQVVIATGGARATIPGTGLIPGSHLLHTLDDAIALRSELRPGARVVIVGGGLIGSEVAATARGLGARVTLVDGHHLPLARTLGIEIAALCAAVHEDHGVRTRFGTPASRVLGSQRVTGVELTDGRVLRADVVVAGVGAHPATEWLRGSGVKVRDGVLTDAGCVTNLPDVVAVGDSVRYHCVHRGHKLRFDHWSHAMNQPPVAVRNLLARRTITSFTAVPHFWSQQYGSTMQFAGYGGPKDKVEIVDGSPDARKFVATFRRGGKMMAVFAMNSPKQFAYYRRRLHTELSAEPALSR